MKTMFAFAAAAAVLLASTQTTAQAARDRVWAAGSSTVFPFATRVAENYARKSGKKAPRVESLGTGGGIKLFCNGVGPGTPDIATASRRMRKSEFDQCAAKGVKDIVELRFGFDGIVVAIDKDAPDYNFNTEHLYLALSSTALVNGKLVKNPYNSWDDIKTGLPANPILVYGPPPTSGTRDAFVELAIEEGARKFPTLAEYRSNNETEFKKRIGRLREDKRWVDAGENDNAIVQTLTRTPGAMGVFGYSFLDENRDKVKAASIGGVRPTDVTIANGSYPLSRSLYIYVKKAHLKSTPGLREFLAEYMSDVAAGRGGYLADRGLITLPPAQLAAARAALSQQASMKRPSA